MRYLSILITLLTSYIAWSQKPYAEIIVDHKNVEVGHQFNVIVKSNISGQIEIKLPKEFEQGFNVMNRMEQEYDGNTGEVVTYFFHGRAGSISEPGKYTFGPALIKKDGRVYRSNKVTVVASKEEEVDQKNVGISLMRKPAFGIIELSKHKVYAGEAFVTQCKIVSQFKPSHYESYHSYTFDPAADQHKLGTNTQPTVDFGTYRNQRRFLFDHDKQVVFLNAPGKVNIEPFVLTLQAGYKGYEVRSRKNHIRVLPLPEGAPETFSGGVGYFEVACKSDKTNVRQGDMVTFTVVMSGHGNLHDVNKPKVNFGEHFEIYGDPEVKEKFAFSKRGSEGEIHIVYHLHAIKDGNGQFNPIEMSFFDPDEEIYKTIQAQPKAILIESNPDFIVEKKTEAPAEASINRFNTKDDKGGSFFSSTAFKVIGVTTPICLAFLFLIFRKKKEEDEEPKMANEPAKGLPVSVAKIRSTEFLSILEAHANNRNELPFFTQLSQDLRKATSQAAKNDPDWILSTEDAKAFFASKGYSQTFQDEYFALQQTCELCRYGCQKPEDDLNIYVAKAKSIFETLEA